MHIYNIYIYVYIYTFLYILHIIYCLQKLPKEGLITLKLGKNK